MKSQIVRACLIVFTLFLANCSQAETKTSPNTLTEQELQSGWIQLFDGKTMFGWRVASKADWKVVDGSLRVTSGQAGLLHTTTQFSDYELKLDFRAAIGTNSGIFLRTSPKPSNMAKDCYELNIAPADNPFPTGSFVSRKKAADVTHDDAWHHYHVTANGGKFVVRLDDEIVLEYTDPKPLGRGFIGLQLNSGQVKFRNIRLKPLQIKSIFNGKDLAGWKVYPGEKSRFSVKDGALRIQDGRGQIETENQWADFVLQTEVFVNGKGLNSGIFFRSIPGDFWMGYESQIHNGFKDGDRTKSVDHGTGGIFRRQKARRVVADDFTWIQKTIICEGKHMAVWVNGIQVSDWKDGRKPHENPRKGLRLEKGTIILQGHDATTDLSFRKFLVGEIARRR